MIASSSSGVLVVAPQCFSDVGALGIFQHLVRPFVFMKGLSIVLLLLQNKRGGKVKLQSILMPLSEFDHDEKGDALYG